MTTAGKALLANFLRMADDTGRSSRRSRARSTRRDLGARRDGRGVWRRSWTARRRPRRSAGCSSRCARKGEAIDELVGAATAMRARATPLACPVPERGIDTCGTGGDGAGTINVSTIAAILVAACGRRGREARQPRAIEQVRVGRRARGARHRRRRRARRGRALHGRREHRLRCSRRSFTWRRVTRPARAASSARARSSTCSGRSPTPRTCGISSSASTIGGGASRSRRRSARWALRRAAVVHGGSGLDELAVRGATARRAVGRRARAVPDADAGRVRPRRRRSRGSRRRRRRAQRAVMRDVLDGREIGPAALEAAMHAAGMTARARAPRASAPAARPYARRSAIVRPGERVASWRTLSHGDGAINCGADLLKSHNPDGGQPAGRRHRVCSRARRHDGASVDIRPRPMNDLAQFRVASCLSGHRPS